MNGAHARLSALATLGLFTVGCPAAKVDGSAESHASGAVTGAPAATTIPSAATTGGATTTSAALTASAPAEPTACPADMALVSGNYCPNVVQVCVEQPKVLGGEGYLQCQRFSEPTCASKARTPMRFCMDTFEWPNERGALPRTLTSWPEAKSMCESKGKRLCTMDEFNFACEGEAMNAFVYGNARDATACNFDRRYIERTYNYERWDECMAKPACKAEFDRLDQRVPAGSMPRCVSPHGVFDLNGNVNEWVVRTDQRSPNRSGLKGGWWGPVRDRCRPMTTFHLEGDYGYEAGFRCCKDSG
ncbi:MAG: SUMF1/EgtB/PvdO family nonheme iron enzyme [Deltaproteobacteria bacterium]|nr:SUMF1/EgtB/PvdO family nonheme iron enzyme [Deltaproteobacteria bacterium]